MVRIAPAVRLVPPASRPLKVRRDSPWDRVGADEFHLTQEFLAQMLGVRRPSVTVAAGLLQKAGLIRYQRGRIHIADRAGLETTACECYETVRQEFNRLLNTVAA